MPYRLTNFDGNSGGDFDMVIDVNLFTDIDLPIDPTMLRNIFLDSSAVEQEDLHQIFDLLPNLKNFAFASDFEYNLVNVVDQSPELKKSVERLITEFPRRIIGGCDFEWQGHTRLPGLKGVVAVWKKREQAFRLISHVGIVLASARKRTAVGKNILLASNMY